MRPREKKFVVFGGIAIGLMVVATLIRAPWRGPSPPGPAPTDGDGPPDESALVTHEAKQGGSENRGDEIVRKWFGHEDDGTVSTAILELSKLPDREPHYADVEQKMDDPRNRVGEAAIHSAGNYERAEERVKKLRAILSDESRAVGHRTAAAGSLAKLRDARSLQLLAQLMVEDESLHVRYACHAAFNSLVGVRINYDPGKGRDARRAECRTRMLQMSMNVSALAASLEKRYARPE